MTCPQCGQRKARRACPALGQTICAVCCGTKRLVDIACPSDCAHLLAAREHPAAAVKRQQERDVALLLPAIHHLTERQHQLFFVFQTVIGRHTPEGFARLNDEDVAEAASTMAATLETSARGVIYEHSAQSAVAQRLVREFKATLDELRREGATIYDRETALVLRAIEQGARETRTRANEGATAYLDLMGRLLHLNNRGARDGVAEAGRRPASSILLP